MNSETAMKILVVEDDDDIQFAIRIILESAGYTVISASHGGEALELIARNGLPDLILLDMLMPTMDGWQFAAEFRNLYDRQVPILVMTAASDAAQRGRDVGADGYVSKPFTVEDLTDAIAQHGEAAHRRKSA
jgi:CheY-like chemotaxis protein